MEIRGVQGAGVLKTLLDRKLISETGRKNVVGKPILYKTTKDFLVQFGLKDLSELPTLKEFEELGRLELVEDQPAAAAPEVTPEDAAATEAPAAEGEPEAGTDPQAEPISEASTEASPEASPSVSPESGATTPEKTPESAENA
jgi:segregation and condensation protein B